MPAHKIDIAMRAEADRMSNAIFDPEETESERTVIISERQGAENQPSIEQHSVIALSPRPAPDEYIVKLTGIGQARPTYGTHRAVEAVGEWVASLHDGARVLARSIAP